MEHEEQVRSSAFPLVQCCMHVGTVLCMWYIGVDISGIIVQAPLTS